MAIQNCDVGGQAVIEGVMMRAPSRFVIAVRTPENEIIIRKKDIAVDRKGIAKQPIIRGVIALYHSLVLGMSALNFSAYHATGEGEEKMSKLSMAGSMVLGLGLGVLLFLYLPLLLTGWARHIIPSVETSSVMFNFVDGVIRVIFFLAYVGAIGLWSDVRRVFEYHGAEHKAIATFEAGKDLTIDNARGMSRVHARCGTSFLLIVMLISIFFFSFIPNESHFMIKFGARIVLIPLIAGVSYEALKFGGRNAEKAWVKTLITPGLWLQRLTTREPSDDQIEVALVSIREALDKDAGVEVRYV